MFQKKIKSIFFCLCFSFLLTSLYARNGAIIAPVQKPAVKVSPVYQITPKSVGHPIIVGGLKELTKEQIDKIPSFKSSSNMPPLPHHLSNKNKYLRPVFDQGSTFASSAQAAGIGYHYTYSINLMRDSDASLPGNRYMFFYTWNFLNGGDKNGGSNFLEGWEMANENGIPDSVTWGSVSPTQGYSQWMTGYNKYYAGMLNRYVTIRQIDIGTWDGVTVLKKWIKDFDDQALTGGIATFSVNCLQPLMNDTLQKSSPDSKYEAGKCIVPAFGEKGGHVMNIIGWEDSLYYDVNGDGKITEDEDITHDSLIDLRDRELGAWIVVNSWSENFADTGFFYMMFRVGALEQGNAYKDTASKGDGKVVNDSLHMNVGGLNTDHKVFVLRGQDSNAKIKQQLTYKVTMDYTQRDKISLLAGISNDTLDTVPEFSKRFNEFNYQGGAYPMQGVGTTDPIEIGLDVKHLLNYVDNKKARYFLMIDCKGGGTGKVGSFSMFDSRGTTPAEATCSKKDVAINAGRTILWIDYESAGSPLVITTDSLIHGQKGKSYTQQLVATGGTQPYTWEQLKNTYYKATNSGTYPAITAAVTPDDQDDGLVKVGLGFSFPFFGETKDTVYVGTDGTILFENVFVHVRSQISLMATKAIAALGYDLLYKAGDAIYVTTDPTKATIRWQTKHINSDTGVVTVDLDFAVELYPSGQINYFYKTLSCDIRHMAIGASGGEGFSNFLFDYGSIAEIPASHKVALVPEKEVFGLYASSDGIFGGTVYNDTGEYRVTFAVTDSMLVKKTKTFILKVDETAINNPFGVNLISPLKVIKGANSSVIFSFATKNVQQTSLEIFGMNGQKITTVFNSKLAAGPHKMAWNLDGKNRSVPNGIYLCKLTVGKERVVQRVAICR